MSVSASPSASSSVSSSESPSVSPSPGQPDAVYTREANGNLSSTKDDLSTIYTTPEEGDVYKNDSVFVCISGGNNAYLIHQFKKNNDNRHDRIKVRIGLKSSLAPSLSPVLLQMWNGINNAWETMDTNNSKSANEKFSLYADVTDTSYFDFRESHAEACVRVYQLNNSGSEKQMCIDLVQISFIAQYKNKYNAVGNRYKNKYNSKESVYKPKNPHKNPQDDDNLI
jgi:hypothetical protein